MIFEKDKTIKIITEGSIPPEIATHRIVTCPNCFTIFDIIEEEYDQRNMAAGQTIINPQCPLCGKSIDVIIKDE